MLAALPTPEIDHNILYSDLPTYFKVLKKICNLLKNRKIIFSCWFCNSKNMQLTINQLLYFTNDINDMFNKFEITFSNSKFGSFSKVAHFLKKICKFLFDYHLSFFLEKI